MRGGKRAGAGRPSTRQGQKVVSIRLLPEYCDKLTALSQENKISTGQMVEKLIDSYK